MYLFAVAACTAREKGETLVAVKSGYCEKDKGNVFFKNMQSEQKLTNEKKTDLFVFCWSFFVLLFTQQT